MVILTLKDREKARVLIAQTGNSLRVFSEKAGMSHTYLSQILNGRRNPSVTIGHKIAKGLNKEIEDIFFIKVVDDNEQIRK